MKEWATKHPWMTFFLGFAALGTATSVLTVIPLTIAASREPKQLPSSLEGMWRR